MRGNVRLKDLILKSFHLSEKGTNFNFELNDLKGSKPVRKQLFICGAKYFLLFFDLFKDHLDNVL